MTTLTHSPDNEEALDPGAEVAQFEAEVAKLGDITVETEAHANALVNREIELRKRLDLQRIAEVAPHIEGQRTVNGFYNPLIARCQEAVRSVRQKINAFIEAERARREAEARVAYEAAIAAEEAAVEAEDPFDEFEKTEAAKKAAIAARDTHLAAKRPVAVRGGGRTHLACHERGRLLLVPVAERPKAQGTTDGVGRLPDGVAFYQAMIEEFTTTLNP